MPTVAFTGTGQSNQWLVAGKATVIIASKSDGGVGTVKIERSFDGGTTWTTLSKNADGDDASYAVSGNSDVGFSGVLEEPLSNVYYRFNCTAHTSGTVYAAIGTAALAFGTGPL